MSEIQFTPDLIMSALLVTVKKDVTDNVTVSYNPKANNYRISIRKKGVTAGTMIRTKKQGIHKWNWFIRSFEKYCIDLKKAVNELDSDAHVTMLILNDINPEHTLLTIADGVTVYNFMDEKQKRGES